MAESTPKTLMLENNSECKEDVGQAQMIFDFFEEVEESSGSSCDASIDFDSIQSVDDQEGEEEESDENAGKAEAAKAFGIHKKSFYWTTSVESKIRQATKDAVKELNSVGVNCICRRRVADGCRKCTLKEICNRLQSAGYLCTICKSQWRSSPEIPAGEHTYLQVVDSSNSKKKGEVKVIIELNFQAEFLMARACEEYNRLINQLPEVFVGKAERLRNLVKILCCASKKCITENKMHMAPWRKKKYMQAKWLGKPERQQAPSANWPEGAIHLERPPKAKASMLTFVLLDNLPGLHHAPMIKVV